MLIVFFSECLHDKKNIPGFPTTLLFLQNGELGWWRGGGEGNL